MIGFGLKAFPVFSDRLIGAVWTFYVLSMFCHRPAKPFTGPYPSKRGHEMLRLLRAFHQHMFYVPSTYVLRLINICSTSHQHMFYFHQHIFYVSSTSHLRYIYEGSTSHLRRIDVSSTKDRRLIDEGSTSHRRGTLKRNESMFHLSPNQVVLAAFSCTKQVDGKPE